MGVVLILVRLPVLLSHHDQPSLVAFRSKGLIDHPLHGSYELCVTGSDGVIPTVTGQKVAERDFESEGRRFDPCQAHQ